MAVAEIVAAVAAGTGPGELPAGTAEGVAAEIDLADPVAVLLVGTVVEAPLVGTAVEVLLVGTVVAALLVGTVGGVPLAGTAAGVLLVETAAGALPVLAGTVAEVAEEGDPAADQVAGTGWG